MAASEYVSEPFPDNTAQIFLLVITELKTHKMATRTHKHYD